MSRRRAELSKIVAAADQSAAEMELPNSVGDHTAESMLSGLVIHSANTRRRPDDRSVAANLVTARELAPRKLSGKSGSTGSAGEWGLPRYNTKVCSGCLASAQSHHHLAWRQLGGFLSRLAPGLSRSPWYSCHCSITEVIPQLLLQDLLRCFFGPSVARWSGADILAIPACSISRIASSTAGVLRRSRGTGPSLLRRKHRSGCWFAGHRGSPNSSRRRATPPGCSNPFAESDRSCGHGSVRS